MKNQINIRFVADCDVTVTKASIQPWKVCDAKREHQIIHKAWKKVFEAKRSVKLCETFHSQISPIFVYSECSLNLIRRIVRPQI